MPEQLFSCFGKDLRKSVGFRCRMAGGPRRTISLLGLPAETYAFEWARSFATYENEVARSIVMLKFERIEPLAKWFAERLAELYSANGELFRADVVVPVPLYRRREKERG